MKKQIENLVGKKVQICMISLKVDTALTGTLVSFGSFYRVIDRMNFVSFNIKDIKFIHNNYIELIGD